MERCREHSRLGLIAVDSTAGVMGLTGSDSVRELRRDRFGLTRNVVAAALTSRTKFDTTCMTCWQAFPLDSGR